MISLKHSEMLTHSIAAVIPKWNQKTMEFRHDDGTNKLFHEVLYNFGANQRVSLSKATNKITFHSTVDPIWFYDPHIKFEIGSINGR